MYDTYDQLIHAVCLGIAPCQFPESQLVAICCHVLQLLLVTSFLKNRRKSSRKTWEISENPTYTYYT